MPLPEDSGPMMTTVRTSVELAESSRATLMLLARATSRQVKYRKQTNNVHAHEVCIYMYVRDVFEREMKREREKEKVIHMYTFLLHVLIHVLTSCTYK